MWLREQGCVETVKMKEKVDKPEEYHSFLFSNKVFEIPFNYGYGFLVELECRHILLFADTTEEEKKLKKIFCVECRGYKQIERYRRVEIDAEVCGDCAEK